MDILEVLAIIILAGAILVLLYYYLQNNPDLMDKVRTHVPSSIQSSGEEEKIPGSLNMAENVNDNPNASMGEKIKVKFKDIDMPNFNTDIFSKKVDSFLDEKSDELIKDWKLATKDDIDILEKRCEVAYRNVDELAKRFNEYREYTNERIDHIDKRLKKLEENND